MNSLDLRGIPRVGFGLDFQLQPPSVMRRLADRFKGRLSHVSVVAMINEQDAKQFKQIFAGLPLVHHLSNVAPGDADGPHLDRLDHLDSLSQQMGAVWCGEDIGAWSIGPYDIPYFAPPLFERDVAQLIGERVATVERRSSVPFLAEIPSCSFVAGRISLGEFFHEIVERSGCKLVIDVSHVFSYALYTGQEPRDVLQSLPLGHVWEAHIAGGGAKPSEPYYYVDNHTDLILPEVADLLAQLVASAPSLRAVTYEFSEATPDDQVDEELTRLERLLADLSFVPSIAEPSKQQ
ncbi:DUF692 family multinuclear iron-containing protein [Piscinibacter gummiphilus]|uniref:DUF692 family protein n=1 Tax=Piscinibacter gummiphilus TaxID=946333 RepID=A0ABZ0D7V7_9BURK|nr:DUF692 family multinuclear iron-containing protein [Piscinibacter gummiphilus]WOB11352.1 DUF692 family protein [Piscinibacter gummiphilus]